MRLSLRFILPLALVLGAIAYMVVPLIDALTLRWFVRDLDMRSKLVANAVQEPLADLARGGAHDRILNLFGRVLKDERLYAIALCEASGSLVVKTATFPEQLGCEGLAGMSHETGTVLELSQGPLHVMAQSLEADGQRFADLILVHDMSFVQRRSADTRRYVFYLFIMLGAAISAVTVVIAQLSWRGWISSMRALLKGEGLFQPFSLLANSELRPIAGDLKTLIRDLESNRQTRDESRVSWTPKALRTVLSEALAGDEILLVSNREPYIHVRRGDEIETQVPASGLVTALEPVMRACSGTWIAHGSGSADREGVDEHDHVHVPPNRPEYRIRRVWLTSAEEAGYYYGFANEGLWPLCHIAHTRPTFRSSDWSQYERVNRRFAEAVLEEATTENPVILVQDYHFALLPRMISEKLPDATIITFWHIPWPNPEAFGICPWREELLSGLLGSSILGFHTRFHCNNFVDTVDRFLEARIERETSTIQHGGKVTAVNHYPISIEWPLRWIEAQLPIEQCRERIRQQHGLPPNRLIGIGVDRLDYTKGILERFMAVERLLEMEPQWIGRFTFIQIAAPSRTRIDQYQHFEQEVRALAARINARFAHAGYEPIRLKVEHHSPAQVVEHFRGADLCFVSSLHDGMNLVAKEFVASRDDERGVLVLSQFAGASRELPEALIVNPYNVDQCAAALHAALSMPQHEQRERMRSMRALVQEYNVYRWAGRMLIDASRIRRQRRILGRTVAAPARATIVNS
jgi:trehalose 6-phosphate synthase